jgi:hypothetical protein
MELLYKDFKLTKDGNPPDEYEDASCFDPGKRLVAIADGATESSFAREWAQILTCAFVEDPGALPAKSTGKKAREATANWLKQWLQPLQKKWAQSINGTALPYFARANFRQGAYSTFLGLRFEDPPMAGGKYLRWQAVAIGDSMLFKLHGNRMGVSFPLGSSKDFVYAPALICSRLFGNENIWEKIQLKSGTCRSGDVFILSTDALAKWLFSRQEAGSNPWSILRNLNNAEDFNRLVEKARAANELRNDDTTLILINVEE